MKNSLRHNQYKTPNNLNARIALHERFSKNPLGMFPWYFEQYDLPSDAHILELGCGPGTVWREHGDRMGEDWQLVLSDFSEGMLETARMNLSDPRFRFACVNADAIPFPDNHFDAVFAHFMLYHVADLQQGLREVRRVLKPGGQLYAVTNGRGHMQENYQLINDYLDGEDFVADIFDHADFGFDLDNGTESLSEVFEHVELRLYEDGLQVTDSGLLTAYVLSSSLLVEKNFPEDWGVGFQAYLDSILARDGVIEMTKRSGMFVAQ